MAASDDKHRLGRVLLKLSGEALRGADGFGVNRRAVDRLSGEIASIVEHGTEVGVVTGAGNFFRGVSEAAAGIDRATADHMGMLATVLNALALRAGIERAGVRAEVMSAIPLQGIAERYDRRRAIAAMRAGAVVVFAGGTGNPFFTTDTAAALRALEIEADALLMAKNGVDGVYDKDPRTNKDARLIQEIAPLDAVAQGLRVMDHAALSLCADNHMRIHVFNIETPGAASKLVRGERLGTLVSK